MSTEWIHHKRKNWPEGSLERQLALRGVKTLAQAVQNQVKNNRELKELQEKLKESESSGDDNGGIP